MARITAMFVRLEPEVREQLGLAAKQADTAPSTLAAEIIAAGLDRTGPEKQIVALDCNMCRLVADTFADVHPMQRWLVEFLEAVVVHGADDVAGTLAAARLLDELRAAK